MSVNRKRSLIQNSCTECTESDDMHMVQCDECDLWTHYGCAGVGPEIEFVDWSCRLCRVTSIGLSLTEVPAKQVDAPVSIESTEVIAQSPTESAEAIALKVDSSVGTETNNVFKFVKEPIDLYPMHLRLEDEATFHFYQNELAKLRGKDMPETVREISQKLISDELLQHYSYLGRRRKLRFKDFDNLTRVIVSSTIESLKRVYTEKHGEDKAENKDENKKLYDEVENYFTKEFIKKAPTRYEQSMNQ